MATVEIARFSTTVGIEHAAVVSSARRVDEVLRQTPGFVRRSLAHDAASATWIDIVHWQDHASATKAQEAMMQHPTALEYFSLMESETVSLQHFDLIALE